jgi:hypothetical protein
MTDKWIRGKSMGMQLERISRGLNTDSIGHRWRQELEKINDLQKGVHDTNPLLRCLFSLNKKLVDSF